MVGCIISMEKDLVVDGYTDITTNWTPKVIKIMGYNDPRISTGYGILLYFTNKVRF